MVEGERVETAREQSLQPFSEMKSRVPPRERTTLVLHFFLLLQEPACSSFLFLSSPPTTQHASPFSEFLYTRPDCMLSAIFTAMDGRNCFIRNHQHDAVFRKTAFVGSLSYCLPLVGMLCSRDKCIIIFPLKSSFFRYICSGNIEYFKLWAEETVYPPPSISIKQ